ncbi:hypothetical protein FS749_014997 [Ceratobasidium sp. UAMH 11750]|nr:hypothetical protein FS749_014997 [Ceratobasidium sp. UAMH 11750]
MDLNIQTPLNAPPSSPSDDGWIYHPDQANLQPQMQQASTSSSQFQPAANAHGLAPGTYVAIDATSNSPRIGSQPTAQSLHNWQFNPSIAIPPTYFPTQPIPQLNLAGLRALRAIPARTTQSLSAQAAPTQPAQRMQHTPKPSEHPQPADELTWLGRKRLRIESHSPPRSSSPPRNLPTRASALANANSGGLASAFNSAAKNIPNIATQRLAEPRAPGGSPPKSAHDASQARESRTTNMEAPPPNAEPQTNQSDNPSSQEGNNGRNEQQEQQIMEEIYSNHGDEGGPPNWTKIYQLIDSVLSKQDKLSKAIKHIQESGTNPRHDNGTANNMTPNAPNHPQRSTHTSPPEPPIDPKWDQTVRCTLPAGRRARAARHTAILSSIRETILKMLDLTTLPKGSTLPAPPPSSVRAPTQDRFCIRWDQTEKTPFNKIAAGLVVQEMCNAEPNSLTAEEVKRLPKLVEQHIRYLCRRYKNENREDADEFNAKRLKRCSANSRKQMIFETRMRVLDRFPVALEKHRQLIVHLGVSETSSDEEDEEDKGLFRVRQKPELSSRVTQLKRNLDHVYALYYKDLPPSRPLATFGLPVTCMSRAWLQTLSDAEKEFYRFQPHKYDYSFPMELFNPENAAHYHVREMSVEDGAT